MKHIEQNIEHIELQQKLLVLLQTIQLDKIPSNSHFSLFDDYLQGTIAIL